MGQRVNLIDFLELYEPMDLFEGVIFPAGINVDTLKETIVDYCALLEPVYFNYALFNRKIKTFFNRKNSNYEKLIDVWLVDYDPISNYDRTQVQETLTNDINVVTQNKRSDISNSGETLKSAYDSSEYQPDSKDTSTSGVIDSNSENGTNTGTVKFTDRTSGNIGVTTTQQMIESELKLRRELNLYELIARDFLNEFMVRL